MFTGIIKTTGVITRIEKKGGDMRMAISSSGLDWSQCEIGESIAVNGVCLTAVRFADDGFLTDVSLETMQVTALAALSVGSRVNLEPALRLSDRLGGHFVSGHVDCVGTLSARVGVARSVKLTFDVPAAYLRYIAKKGSVCIDGVSLTVNEVSDAAFTVNIIPHTLTGTIIGDYQTGTTVNIEVDLLARYLEQLLDKRKDGDLTRDFLRANGYVR